MRTCRIYLGLILAIPSIAIPDGRLRVMIIDTGIDTSNAKIREVLCADENHFNAVTGKVGIPKDEHGHGTHVAGIIRALSGNRGYCLATCKYYSDANPGSVNLKNTVTCLKRAKEIGARIINYSGGGPEFSEDEFIALKDLLKTGATFVAAAGNEHQDVQKAQNRYYPGSYSLPGEIVVGGVDVNGKRVPTSNYGKTVTTTALGESVYSTLLDGRFGYMSGTSQATAVVTGLTIRRLLHLPGPRSLDPKGFAKYLKDYWTAAPR